MSILSAIGGLAGAFLTNQSQNKAAKVAAEAAARQEAYQREFAQSGVQWRVADAKKAGVHPLYALGANVPGYSPVAHIGAGTQDFSAIGQSLGRALDQTMDTSTRALTQLQLERAGLENELLRTQIMSSRATMQPARTVLPSPATRYGMDGQGQTAVPGTIVTFNPMKVVGRSPENPGHEAASIPDIGWSNTPDGGFFPVMTESMAERMEEDIIGSLQWGFRNRVMPYFSQRHSNPPPGAEDYRMESPLEGVYRPRRVIPWLSWRGRTIW